MPEVVRYQQYEVLRRDDGSLWELGRGAMGITYKAFDTNLRCPVALKVINSTYLQNDNARQRFLREARAAAALRHPNVASVFNLSTDQDNYFYVMEFIDGETVEALVKRKGRLEPTEALNIILQVARALTAAAKQKLVHRDLKPSNLMLVDDEGESVVKVIDFGLAKSAKDSTEDSAALTVGGFVGTPHFASPEQVEERDLDVRSDIYSLGATFYFMLTGKAPFIGSVGQVMSQHLYKPIAIEPLVDVPQCVVSLIQSMLEKDSDKRPQTPRDLQDAIVACLEEIRTPSTRSIPETGSAPPESAGPTVLLPQSYRLVEPLGERPQGQYFLAEDLQQHQLVRQLTLRPEFISDPLWLEPLKVAVERLRNAPNPMLRAVYSLKTAPGEGVLLEEHVVGTTLLDFLRARSILSAPEVVRLASLLAPLADHAGANRLEFVDLSLFGITLVNRESTAADAQRALSERSLVDPEHLELKVDGIDFSFASSQANTLMGLETLLQSGPSSGPRGSYVRALSLLCYELLGGPRARVEASGQYRPIAALTQEGNAVLRRGLVDECPSAAELVRQLAATVGPKELTSQTRASQASEGSRGTEASRPIQVSRQSEKSEAPLTSVSENGLSGAQEAVLPAPPSRTQPDLPTKRPVTPGIRRLALAVGSLAVGIAGYLVYLLIGPSQEIASLSIQSDPPGASILLDGKPPQTPPNTFTHVPFGTHRVTATLDNYEPVKQDLQVRSGMTPEIRLHLTEKQGIAALFVQTDPPGASILLDGKPPQGALNTFKNVPFGTHQLVASLDNYEPIRQSIEVHSGMDPFINLKLNPRQEIAALSVQTDPPGASILLDGKPPQAPPNTFKNVVFGTHQLTATLDGYEPAEQQLQVHSGMSQEIQVKLNRKLSPTEKFLAELKTSRKGSPQQLNAYVRLAQLSAPNSGEYKKELERLIEQLRTKAPPLGKDEFNYSYKDIVKEAADLDVVPAILWLAENENGNDALNLFLRAAKFGNSYAMMRTGRLYLRKGTPADNEEGFKWLNQAYNAPDRNLEAGAYIGDCYVSGVGTQPDLQKAEEIIMPLAKQDVVPAMTIAGKILAIKADNAVTEAVRTGTTQQRRRELDAQADDLARQARIWWERAVEKGDWNASARLGQCYELGWGGVRKNEEEAEKRYKEGADHGNPISMFFYGLLVSKDPSRRTDAENMISKAASAGLPSAIKWCKEHNVTFTEVRTED